MGVVFWINVVMKTQKGTGVKLKPRQLLETGSEGILKQPASAQKADL